MFDNDVLLHQLVAGGRVRLPAHWHLTIRTARPGRMLLSSIVRTLLTMDAGPLSGIGGGII